MDAICVNKFEIQKLQYNKFPPNSSLGFGLSRLNYCYKKSKKVRHGDDLFRLVTDKIILKYLIWDKNTTSFWLTLDETQESVVKLFDVVESIEQNDILLSAHIKAKPIISLNSDGKKQIHLRLKTIYDENIYQIEEEITTRIYKNDREQELNIKTYEEVKKEITNIKFVQFAIHITLKVTDYRPHRQFILSCLAISINE
jgi:hypothetical protein